MHRLEMTFPASVGFIIMQYNVARSLKRSTNCACGRAEMSESEAEAGAENPPSLNDGWRMWCLQQHLAAFSTMLEAENESDSQPAAPKADYFQWRGIKNTHTLFIKGFSSVKLEGCWWMKLRMHGMKRNLIKIKFPTTFLENKRLTREGACEGDEAYLWVLSTHVELR